MDFMQGTASSTNSMETLSHSYILPTHALLIPMIVLFSLCFVLLVLNFAFLPQSFCNLTHTMLQQISYVCSCLTLVWHVDFTHLIHTSTFFHFACTLPQLSQRNQQYFLISSLPSHQPKQILDSLCVVIVAVASFICIDGQVFTSSKVPLSFQSSFPCAVVERKLLVMTSVFH
jgi:hypothetical protein